MVVLTLLLDYLNINGVNAKEHQVFRELTRVRQYFSKIQETEDKHLKPKITLNKQAATRVIQHNLVWTPGGTYLSSNVAQASNHFVDKKSKEELAEIERRKEELKKKIIANQNRKKSTASPLSTSATPVAASPAVTPPEAAQAAELLDSVAKDIEMQDQEGSEEGEIDEGPEIQHALPPRSEFDSSPAQAQSRKRKHNEAQANGHTNGLANGQSPFQKAVAKADKKARKKARKEAKNAG